MKSPKNSVIHLQRFDTGVPEEFIRPERDRDALRRQRAAAEEKARLEAGMEKVAGAVPLEKKVEQGSVLDMIMQGASGNA